MAFVSHLPPLTFSHSLSTTSTLTNSSLKFPLQCRPATITMVSKQEPAGGGPKTKAELAALYGGSYLGTSIALSTISFIMWYAAVSAGVNVPQVLNAMGNWLETTPLGRPAVLDNISGEVGAFALAYIAHKATSPFRFPLTVAATPVVAKWAGKVRKENKDEGETPRDNVEEKT